MQEDTPLLNIISFYLTLNEPRYVQGLFRNIELAEEIYPEWVCRVFVSSEGVDETTIRELKDRDNVQVVVRGGDPTYGSLWRLEVADDPTVERFIVRNVECRLSIREKEAVDEWVESGKEFHMIRDHPWQMTPISTELFGMVVGSYNGVTNKAKSFVMSGHHKKPQGICDAFLWGYVWPIAQNSCHVNDPFSADSYDFPTPERDVDELVLYVGEKFDENNNHSPYQRRLLEQPIKV